MSKIILEMKNIFKSFPGVQALKGIDFYLEKGEVNALVGENGAGKSTLMRVLTGIYDHDQGEIIYKDKKVEFKSAKESFNSGIAIIHQEFNLFPNLTAAENIFIGNPEIKNKIGFIKKKKMISMAQKLVDSLGANFDVNDRVDALSVQHQQVVEIAKALSTNAEVVIMDEPTSALPDNEVNNLFKTIHRLQEQGVSIIYVSHRMNEVFEISQSITVLRDGMTVDKVKTSDTTQKEIISMMIGKEVKDLYPKEESEIGVPVIRIEDVSDGDIIKGISFEVKAGEILGLYGLIGSGATECPDVIFGLNKMKKGEIFLKGRQIRIKSPKDAIENGIAYVPADRHRQGIIRQLSVRENISLAILKKLNKGALTDLKAEKNLAEEYKDRLNIRTPSIEQLVNNLSGGNQQKTLISKWLVTEPSVLILNDPTRGVDVGAKTEIYSLISDLACQGIGIIITSSDMPEILGMADRIIVFKDGQIVSEYSRSEATQKALLEAANA